MEAFGTALYFAGAATAAVALIWSFVVVSRENPVVAVLCLFLPLGLPVALLLRWPQTWRPLAAWLLGLTLLFCGLAIRTPGS
jgi:hypothetical protein